MKCIYLFLELALKILFADDKGIICFAKSIISLDSTNTKIITADILFLFQQLIESFPVYIANYIKPIMVNTNLIDIINCKQFDSHIMYLYKWTYMLDFFF